MNRIYMSCLAMSRTLSNSTHHPLLCPRLLFLFVPT
uniref:Uncharacterized protein n=1 Tax=Rhizophora mucronata TaxID=61149 RepID=A0A2P2IT25_RHIMU